MTDKPEEYTNKELEKGIKLHEELIAFYKQVKFNQEIPCKALEDFLKKLYEEKGRRIKEGKYLP